MSMIPDIDEMRTQRIVEAVRKDSELTEEIKDDLYIFIGELIGTKKAMKIIEGGKE